MALNLLGSLFGKSVEEPFVSVDIGSSAIKLMSLDMSYERPRLIGMGMVPTPAGALNNNLVARADDLAQAVRAGLESNGIEAKKAVFCIPGPCAFTKRINIGHMSLRELEQNINFEAGNYIPHSIDAVCLDYQVLNSSGRSTMEVLLVAVKREIVDGYLDVLEKAGLQPKIADVDYFAMENMFELNYPEEKTKMLALINVGARYTGISLIENGESLFAGDVGVGGRLYTDALCEALGMKPAQAEEAKAGRVTQGFDENLVRETIERTTDHVATEIHRQLGFFWNAIATDRGIEAIYISGGAAQVTGLVEELSSKTGLPCRFVESFRALDWAESIDEEYLQEIGMAMGVSVGLATRRLGDKKHAVE